MNIFKISSTNLWEVALGNSEVQVTFDVDEHAAITCLQGDVSNILSPTKLFVGDNDLGSVRPSVHASVHDLSVRMHISNTNEYGRLIAILFTQINIIFENVVRPDAYLQHQ